MPNRAQRANDPNLLPPGTNWVHLDSARRHGVSSAHFLKLIEEQAGLGCWASDFHDGILVGSAGLYRLLCLEPGTPLTYDLLIRLMHPDDRSVYEHLRETLGAGQPIDCEYRVVRADGVMRWVRNRAEVVLGPDRQPYRAVGVVTDVTSRREAYHAAKRGHDRYHALVQAIAAVVWTASADGSSPDMPSWAQLTGQSHAEMQGEGWLDAVHPEDRARTRAVWRSAVQNRAVYDTDYRVLCADGTHRWFNSRGTPILNGDGTIREWVGVCLSIAGSKRFGSEPVPEALDCSVRLSAGQIRAARAFWSGVSSSSRSKPRCRSQQCGAWRIVGRTCRSDRVG
ncbi:PAS domain-containing protein [Methylobacterium sp. P31]